MWDDGEEYTIAECIVTGTIADNVAFKNCTPFISCISKMNSTVLGDAVDFLDIAMPIYSLIE